MPKLNVYLAGGAFEVYYRKYVKREYGNIFNLIDPMEQDGVIVDEKNRKIITEKTAEEIVSCDKKTIEKSDIFVAYINKYSAGTSMEILYAYTVGIPVYLIVTPSRNFENDFWFKAHATNIFFSIDICFDHIKNQLEEI